MTAPYRSRLLLPETLPFTDARERRWWYTYRSAGPPRVIVSDSFDRADSASSLGTADTGQTWSALAGTWGINGNQAYNPSATANALAVVDSGVADCTVSVIMAARNTGSGLYFRVVDANNWLKLASSSSSAMRLFKCVAGTVSTVATVTGLTVSINNDLYAVRLSGTSITMFFNGAQIGDPQTVTDHATATKHGIGLTSGLDTVRWDDFKVTA